MKTLVVEDNFTNRRLLQRFLSPFGICDIAVDGKEAVDAVLIALDDNAPYDLICLDIMMPEMDGQTVLREVRAMEDARNIKGLDRTKVIMTTALDDRENVMNSFRAQADAYIVKPIDREKLIKQLRSLELVE